MQDRLGSREIGFLVAIADHGSIRRAADALGMTQPGLSKHLRLIEERLGARVFERATTGAEITDFGVLLLDRGRDLLRQMDALVRDARLVAGQAAGRVCFGAGPLLAPIIARRAVVRLLADAPAADVDMRTGSAYELVADLAAGRLDYLLSFAEDLPLERGLSSERLFSVPAVFICSRGHPLTQRQPVPLGDLARWPLAQPRLYPRVLAWLREAGGRDPLIRFACDDYHLIADVVGQTDLITITSPQMVGLLQEQHDIVSLTHIGPPYLHHFQAITPANASLSPVARRLLALIRADLTVVEIAQAA